MRLELVEQSAVSANNASFRCRLERPYNHRRCDCAGEECLALDRERARRVIKLDPSFVERSEQL